MFRSTRTQLTLVLLVALIARVSFWIVYVDHTTESYAEYGIIAKYLYEGKGYSCFSQIPGDYTFHYTTGAHPQPSALMMPGYTLYIYCSLFIHDPVLRSLVLCALQWLVSLIVILILYQWISQWFNDSIALVSIWLYALLPEFIVSANTYSSVVFIHLSIVLLCWQGIKREHTARDFILITIASALLISLRAEALVFLGALAVLKIFRSQRKSALAVATGMLITLTPWVTRNYSVFNAFVPLTTSSGMNLYRGHNPYAVGVWSDDALRSQIRALPFDNHIELSIDSLHGRAAINTIASQPLIELQRTAQKLFTLIAVDTSDIRALHPAYLLPSLLLLLFTVFGYYRMRRNANHLSIEMSLYLLSCMVTTVIFFCLPRYQSMMRVVLIPIAAVGVEYFLRTAMRRQDR